MTLFITNAQAIVACDGFVDSADTGTTNPGARILIYAGSIPADADAALGGATLLATLNMTATTAFGAAVDAGPGAISTAAAISPDTDADATGTAAFFRITDRDNLAICQGGVGTSGEQLNLNTVAIQINAEVSITSMTVTMPES